LAGAGIGGMQAGGIDLGIIRGGYHYGAERQSLVGVPILESATKSLVARWTAPSEPMVESELSDENGLAVGALTNRAGFRLANVRLLYGTWAYRLGTLEAGGGIEVGEQLNPRKVKTIVTHDALSEAASGRGSQSRVFVPEEASAKEILNVMMFYEAAGGLGFAHLPNRYQAFCDLSRSLELGRAILVADATAPVAKLVDEATGDAIGDNREESTVIYRFVLPVKGRNAP
jgi:hypothetical protein